MLFLGQAGTGEETPCNKGERQENSERERGSQERTDQVGSATVGQRGTLRRRIEMGHRTPPTEGPGSSTPILLLDTVHSWGTTVHPAAWLPDLLRKDL